MDLQSQIHLTYQQFSKTYGGGVPLLLNDDGAFLSFICMFAGIEALAGFCFPEKGNGERFRSFITSYFEPRYEPFAGKLWDLRNSIVHGFAPRHFGLCHHNGWAHFTVVDPFAAILNAENFYAAFLGASERYFVQLRSDKTLQAQFETRTASEGMLVVQPTEVRLKN